MVKILDALHQYVLSSSTMVSNDISGEDSETIQMARMPLCKSLNMKLRSGGHERYLE